MKFKAHITALLIATAALTAAAEKITFSADSMSGISGKNSDRTTLTGHANIKADSLEINADKIELYGTDFRFMKASGNIKGINTKSKIEFTCTSMTYDRTSKIAVLRNTVHLIDKENDVTADAELIEYNQNTEVAVMQINVYLVQEENTCTAAHAVYHKKQQLLDMSGNPQVVQNQDVFRAQEISLNLKTDEITMDGHVRGSVTTKDSSNSNSTSDAKKDGSKDDDKKDSEKAKDSSSKEETTDKASEKADDKASDKTEEKADEKTSDKTDEKVDEKASTKTDEKSADKEKSSKKKKSSKKDKKASKEDKSEDTKKEDSIKEKGKEEKDAKQ